MGEQTTDTSKQTVTYFDLTLNRHEQIRDVFTSEVFDTPEAAASLFQHMIYLDREHQLIAMFDAQKRLIGMHTAGIGTLDTGISSVREIFGVLILAKAHSWVIAHNHPSGSIKPSKADNKTTERFAAAATLLGIPLVDHFIIGEGGTFYSYLMSDPGRLQPEVRTVCRAQRGGKAQGRKRVRRSTRTGGRV